MLPKNKKMPNRKIFASLAMTVGLLIAASCDDIDEVDRITVGEVQKTAVTGEQVTVEFGDQTFTYTNQHRLLIEDFTGWRCVNCPNMAAFLHQNIESVFPSVVVSLHPAANSLSNTDAVASRFSLSCTLADEIANMVAGSTVASSMSLPAVSINQKPYNGQTLLSGDTTTVYNSLRELAMSEYKYYNLFNDGRLTNIAVNVEKISDKQYNLTTLVLKKENDKIANIRLQLWLLESGIVAYQSTQTGVNREYVNNHVLRMAINGNQGEVIKGMYGDFTKSYTLSLEGTNYVPENCSVVAFVSDPSTNEVLNCIEVKL